MLPATCRRWKPTEGAPPGVAQTSSAVRVVAARSMSADACRRAWAAGVSRKLTSGSGPRSQASVPLADRFPSASLVITVGSVAA